MAHISIGRHDGVRRVAESTALESCWHMVSDGGHVAEFRRSGGRWLLLYGGGCRMFGTLTALLEYADGLEARG